MNKKFIITIGIVAIALMCIIYFLNNNTEESILNEKVDSVELLNVSDFKESNATIFAFGEVESIKQVDIKAQVGGEINNIYINVGDVVNAGDLLVELDHSSLDVQLEQAEAAVEIAQSSLEQVLAGATDEQKAASKAQMDAAEKAYNNAQDTFNSTVSINDKNLNSLYDSAKNTLSDTYIKAQAAYNAIKGVREAYFTDNDQQGITVRDYESIVLSEMNQLKSEIDNEDIGSAILFAKDVLLDEQEALQEIENISNTLPYRDIVSSTNKTLIATQKTYINAAYTALNSIENNISLLIDQNQSSLKSLEAQVSIAESNYEAAKSSYEALIVDPRDVDISTLEASVKQAQAAYNLVKNNRDKAFIRAPFYGKISSLPIKENNLVSVGQIIVSMINDSGIQVKTYISSDDRKLIEEGSDVLINGEIDGSVLNIAPSLDSATKKIEVDIVVSEDDPDLLVGEYVNLQIDISDNLLNGNIYFLPMQSIYITPQKTSVFIVNNGEIEEVQIEIERVVNELIEVVNGLDENMLIVKSVRGLEKGDKVEVK
jgi:RND family efflux transporter MFP subunit